MHIASMISLNHEAILQLSMLGVYAGWTDSDWVFRWTSESV